MLRKKNKVGGFTSQFKNLIQSYCDQVWYWHKDRNIDQWNRSESAETNPDILNKPIFDKDASTVQWKKE